MLATRSTDQRFYIKFPDNCQNRLWLRDFSLSPFIDSAERAQKHLAENVRIISAKLGGKAGIYGSFADALDRCPPYR